MGLNLETVVAGVDNLVQVFRVVRATGTLDSGDSGGKTVEQDSRLLGSDLVALLVDLFDGRPSMEGDLSPSASSCAFLFDPAFNDLGMELP